MTPLQAYLLTSGTIFGLVVLAHVLRIAAEGPQLASDPWYLLLTALAAALSVWAFRLFAGLRRP